MWGNKSVANFLNSIVFILCIWISASADFPSIQIESPGKNEKLCCGAIYLIRWYASDDSGILSRSIYLSTDGRESWRLLDSSSGNTGVYSWSVPVVNMERCAIKIFVYNTQGFMCSGETSGEFSTCPIKNIKQKIASGPDRQLITKQKENSYILHMFLPADHSISISNALGKELISFTTVHTNTVYQLPMHFIPGMHIVTIRSSENTFTRKPFFVL